MMNTKIILLIWGLILPALLFAQTPEQRCGTDEVFQQWMAKNPTFKKEFEEFYKEISQTPSGKPSKVPAGRMGGSMMINEALLDSLYNATIGKIITIPVVVHVVYPHSVPEANISMDQIQSQIRELNRAFSQEEYPLNPLFPNIWGDVFSDDTRIRFCLAKRDPEGNPTNGVTRTITTVQTWPTNSQDIKFDARRGKDIWPRDEYLNIWVGILDGLLGFSQYPFAEFDANTDGIVVDYEAFGTIGTVVEPFHLGKTATHEVGHWLGLPHTWGIYTYNEDCLYDDFVDDTPRQTVPNWGCGPWTITCDGLRDMLPNYMNYAEDRCNVFFTKGQSKRMRATLQSGGFRYPIQKSEAGCSS